MKSVLFSELFERPLRNGITVASRDRGVGMRMIGMKQIFGTDRIRASVGELVPEDRVDRTKDVLQHGDLLFARQSLTFEGAGKCSIFESSDEDCTWESHLIRAQLDPRLANPLFFYYYFASDMGRRNMSTIITQVAAAGVKGTDLSKLLVPLPPLNVQAGVAEVLGALDDKIAANERLSGAVQDLLQERFALLRLDGFTGDGSFLTVSDLFDVNPRTSQKLAGQAPYLGMKDLPDSSMTVGSWSTREAKSGARFINGDVLLARITPCLENGKAGYVDFLENTEVGVGSTEFIVFRARSPLLSAVPFFLTKSERFRDFAIKHMQGTSGRQRLAAADVADYRLAKVDDESLNRFGELSMSLLKRVKTAVSESRALARTRDELLPLLMNGKITVKDAEAVVSDAV